MKRKELEEKACHLGVIGWSSRGGNVEIKRWDNVDSKRERRPLWNTDRAQAPGSATHGADLAARYPEAVLSRLDGPSPPTNLDAAGFITPINRTHPYPHNQDAHDGPRLQSGRKARERREGSKERSLLVENLSLRSFDLQASKQNEVVAA